MGSIRASLIYANTRMKLECIVDVVEEAARGMAAKYHCRYATSIAQAMPFWMRVAEASAYGPRGLRCNGSAAWIALPKC